MLVNRRQVLIEWGQCDPAGIVFYPRYFEIFDASTAHLFASAGLDKFEMRQRFNVVGYPMVDTHATFKIPSRYGEIIEIESRVKEVRNSSFEIYHQVFKEDGRLAIECWEVRVWLGEHPDKPKPKLIPEEVVALLKDLQGRK